MSAVKKCTDSWTDDESSKFQMPCAYGGGTSVDRLTSISNRLRHSSYRPRMNDKATTILHIKSDDPLFLPIQLIPPPLAIINGKFIMISRLLTLLALLLVSISNTHAFVPGSPATVSSRSASLSSPAKTFQGRGSVSSIVTFGKKEARAKGNDSKRKRDRPKKQKDDVIEVDAVVLESLPNAMFRCAIDGAPETQPPILATISGKIRKNFVKILVGDKVLIELSPYDLTRGRITFRYR